MNILVAYQTKNRCYKTANPMTPVGILVHSTGANNPNLKRYVDAPEELGENVNRNHWNNGSITKMVHGFIGYDKNKKIRTVQTLPYGYACWGCANGKKGSYNYNPTGHIQFEICEQQGDRAYFDKAFDEAAEYCAYLCRKFNLDVSTIVSHAEAAKKGYASNHGDPDHWLKKYSKDMNWFRAQVAAKLDNTSTVLNNASTSKPAASTVLSIKPTYKTGAALQLKNVKLYVSSTASTAAKSVLGTYYVWSNEVIKGRIRITSKPSYVGIAGMVTGWIDVPERTFKAGDTVELKATPLYVSSLTKVAALKKTGTFYVWSAELINNRIRITSKPSFVGVKNKVTGWIDLAEF